MDEKDELPQPIPKVGWIGVQFDGCVAALEDKIVQKAACAVLNAIYEEDFLGFPAPPAAPPSAPKMISTLKK